MDHIEVHGTGRRRGAVATAARRRRAVRAVAGRRELRHGADRGLRGGHAGRRVRHRRLPPGRDARPRRPAGAARPPARAGRGAALAVARPRAARGDGRGGPPARRGLRLAAASPSRSPTCTSARSRLPSPASRSQSARRVKVGLRPADMSPRRPRAPAALARARAADRRSRAARVLAFARRAALGLSAVLGVLLAFLALRRVGADNVFDDARALEPELGADRARRCSRRRWSCAPCPGTTSCAPRCRNGR